MSHPAEVLLKLFHKGHKILVHGFNPAYVWAMDPVKRTKKRFDKVHWFRTILPILQARATRKMKYAEAASIAAKLPSATDGSRDTLSNPEAGGSSMPGEVSGLPEVNT